MVISGTVSRPFRRRPEYAFPGWETTKNCHFVNGNPAVSYYGWKIFHVPKRRKNGHFATVSRPFRWKLQYAFWCTETSKNGQLVKGKPAVSYLGRKIFLMPKRRKNGNFAYGKPPVSPASGICFLRLRNVQKWSLLRTGTWPFLILGENFSGAGTSSKTHFANGKQTVSPEARIRFPMLRNVQKWSLREPEPARFVFPD